MTITVEVPTTKTEEIQIETPLYASRGMYSYAIFEDAAMKIFSSNGYYSLNVLQKEANDSAIKEWILEAHNGKRITEDQFCQKVSDFFKAINFPCTLK